MNSTRFMRSVSTLLACSAFSGMTVDQVAAHDLLGLMAERESASEEERLVLEEVDDLVTAAAARAAVAGLANENQDSDMLEAVVFRLLAWDTGKPVTVCFFDGSDMTRTAVQAVASEWLDGTSLKVNFVGQCNSASPSDIRVSFLGVGHYSAIGTSAWSMSKAKQTLNLQGMGGVSNLTDQQKGIVRHEFGHAFGFHHEHQSPVSGCEEEFNFEFLYLSLPWPKSKVDYNLRRLNVSSSKDAVLITQYDKTSVMHYALDRRSFLTPDIAVCFLKQPNNAISPTDHAAMQEVYPIGDNEAQSFPTPATEEERRVIEDLTGMKSKLDRLLSAP
jgi:hypothetical protein